VSGAKKPNEFADLVACRGLSVGFYWRIRFAMTFVSCGIIGFFEKRDTRARLYAPRQKSKCNDFAGLQVGTQSGYKKVVRGRNSKRRQRLGRAVGCDFG